MIEDWKINSNDGAGHWRPVVGACLPSAKRKNTLRGLRGVAAPRYGQGKTLKFAAFFMYSVSGEYIKKEISGPATIGDWNNAWRVFGFAMEVLGAATRTRLKRYSDRIQQMAPRPPVDHHLHGAQSAQAAPRTYQALVGNGILRVATCGSAVIFPDRCALGLGFSRGRQGRAFFGLPKSTRRCSNTAQEQVDRWYRCRIGHGESMRYGHGLLLHPFRSSLLWGLSCFSFI